MPKYQVKNSNSEDMQKPSLVYLINIYKILLIARLTSILQNKIYS